MIIPKKRVLYRYAVDIFVALLKQVQYRKVGYRCNDADVNAWNRFVDYYKDIYIGEDFIKSFAQYGIQSWFNSDMTESQRQNVRFSWVFGLSAIKRWNALGAEKNARIVRKYLKTDYDIKTDKVTSLLKTVYLKLRPVEEKFKQQYHNRKRGLEWCIANTTLYFHHSALCAACTYKVECKEILKSNYPKIYKLRGYDK
jgi:hypothetical protein